MQNRGIEGLARKSNQLTYGVDDRPPPGAALALGLQHAGLALIFMVYPVVAAQALGLEPGQTRGLITSSILAIAAATLLQCLRPPFGSGQLAVHIPTPITLAATIQAGMLGGPGLIAGMTLILGLIEVGLARILRRLRQFLPPEVCGVVVLMLGVSLVHPGLIRFSGSTADPHSAQGGIDLEHVAVAAVTLAVMVLVAVFGRGVVKLFALVLGLLAGVGLSFALGLFDAAALTRLGQTPFVGLPEPALPAWRFELILLPLFALLALVLSVDDLGVLVSGQRLNDADWKRIDMTSGSGGLQANGAGNLVAGALGGSPMGISSAHVGLAFATGATSRVIAFFAAGLLLAAAFVPLVVEALALIPAPVIGAIMIYTAAFMMVSGTELILSRMLSERRTFTVGLSVVAGLSVALLPSLYDGLPNWLLPLFRSELAVAATVAILLNLLFRIGIAQQASVPVTGDRPLFELAQDFLERQGDLWGARRDVVTRAVHAAAETLETLREHGIAEGEIELGARFDEFNLDLFILYHGKELELPEERPDLEAILDDDRALARLAGFLIRRFPDKLTQRREGERHRLTLHFEH